MAWYQVIECDNTVKKPLVCDFSNFEEYGFEEEDFKIGKIIRNWPAEVYFRASQKKYDGYPDDAVQNAFMFPIYSQRLKEKLENVGVIGIQYLPVEIIGFYGDSYGTYYIANLTNICEAFDYEKSVYNIFSDNFPNPYMRGKIAGVKKFSLRNSNLNNCDIFRLAEYNQRFFVTEKVQSLFVENGYTGYSFIEVDSRPLQSCTINSVQ